MNCPDCGEQMHDVDEIEANQIVGHRYECDKCGYIESDDIKPTSDPEAAAECKTCGGVGRLDAVYVPCPSCQPDEELTRLRAEVQALREAGNVMLSEIGKLFWTSSDGSSVRDGTPEDSDAPMSFTVAWKALRDAIRAAMAMERK